MPGVSVLCILRCMSIQLGSQGRVLSACTTTDWEMNLAQKYIVRKNE